ncbi:MAG: hypothetical protein FWC40_00985 [Proteobacteria bacterium]|nr:hypothetical protein [Pseudomonadota bacterium]
MSRFFATLGLGVMLSMVPAFASAQSAQEILAQFNSEPSIEATQQAALEFAGLTSERLESLYSRAGAANALPKNVTYTFQFQDQNRDRPQRVVNKVTSGTSSSYERETTFREETDQIRHNVRAQWDLSQLVYNPDQLRVYSQMNSTARNRNTILQQVTKTYYARRKLQVEMSMNPPTDVADRLKRELAIQELTAQLDAMTGGWYSGQLRQKASR